MTQESTRTNTESCGLGKTFSALFLVCFATRNSADSQTEHQLRSILIVVPASVLLQWVDQTHHFFQDLIIFWGSSTSWVIPRVRKARSSGRTTNLSAVGVKSARPDTGFAIVITFYQIRAKRTTGSLRWPSHLSIPFCPVFAR